MTLDIDRPRQELLGRCLISPPETPPERPRTCKARSSRTGKPCKKAPMRGQLVCDKHGGLAPQNRAAAQRRIAEAAAASAVEVFGLPREIDPRDALLEEVYRTAGAVDWLTGKVRELDPDALTWGVTEEAEKLATEFTGTDTKKTAAINVWVELWQRERKHLMEICRAALAAGIEERRVRLAEQQGALLAGVIKAILGDLELTPAQAEQAPAIVSRHLRTVAAVTA